MILQFAGQDQLTCKRDVILLYRSGQIHQTDRMYYYKDRNLQNKASMMAPHADQF